MLNKKIFIAYAPRLLFHYSIFFVSLVYRNFRLFHVISFLRFGIISLLSETREQSGPFKVTKHFGCQHQGVKAKAKKHARLQIQIHFTNCLLFLLLHQFDEVYFREMKFQLNYLARTEKQCQYLAHTPPRQVNITFTQVFVRCRQ